MPRLAACFARRAFAVVVLAAATFAAIPGVAFAQEAMVEVALTPKHIDGFIGAQKEMAAAASKSQASADKPDPKVEAAMDAIARKYGFKDFEEFDDVAGTISMVMSGLDPQTKAFTEPPNVLRREIAEVEADKSIPAAEKKQILEELREALKSAKPVKIRANIELVKKNFDRINAVMQ